MMTNNNNAPKAALQSQQAKSLLPEISSKDIKEFSAMIQNERSFYQRMGMQFISDMLV